MFQCGVLDEKKGYDLELLDHKSQTNSFCTLGRGGGMIIVYNNILPVLHYTKPTLKWALPLEKLTLKFEDWCKNFQINTLYPSSSAFADEGWKLSRFMATHLKLVNKFVSVTPP